MEAPLTWDADSALSDPKKELSYCTLMGQKFGFGEGFAYLVLSVRLILVCDWMDRRTVGVFVRRVDGLALVLGLILI